jgi:pyruvate formate lyase activating enzyme
MSVTAKITNIARGSLHDGAGVITVVYFKGCGLQCVWCHNPETQEKQQEVFYFADKCIGCGRCKDVCPTRHNMIEGEHVFYRKDCIRCGRCADVCPSGALCVCGEEQTVEQVFSLIKKDEHYYKQSGGGVTLSGGECLLQADFCVELLKKCKAEGIHTAIESAFFVPYENVSKVLPYLDFIYADLKIATTEKHKVYTGHGNEKIIENIRRVSQSGIPMVVRIPVIPSVNDTLCCMDEFAKILRTFASSLIGIELLKYNSLGEAKYDYLGKKCCKFEKEQTYASLEVLGERLRAGIDKQVWLPEKDNA